MRSPRRRGSRSSRRRPSVSADQMLVLTFLAGTYVAWGTGLRANLAANWNLLEETGTSTNALSKAAYDLVGRWTVRERGRRIAAGAGYVATELGMEAPYYVGAVGAATLSDAVSSTEALVFLGGANLGAAGYVYAARVGYAGIAGPQKRPRIRLVRAGLGAEAISDQLLHGHRRGRTAHHRLPCRCRARLSA